MDGCVNKGMWGMCLFLFVLSFLVSVSMLRVLCNVYPYTGQQTDLAPPSLCSSNEHPQADTRSADSQ